MRHEIFKGLVYKVSATEGTYYVPSKMFKTTPNDLEVCLEVGSIDPAPDVELIGPTWVGRLRSEDGDSEWLVGSDYKNVQKLLENLNMDDTVYDDGRHETIEWDG